MEQIEESDCLFIVSIKNLSYNTGSHLDIHNQCGGHCCIHVPCSPQQSPGEQRYGPLVEGGVALGSPGP